MQCNHYNYTYLTISCRLVVFLRQILVSFSGFSLESGLVRAARSLYKSTCYLWDGVVRGHRTQESEHSTQDPAGVCRS